MRMSLGAKHDINEARGAIHRIMHREGRRPTVREIAAEAGMDAEKVYRVMRDMQAEAEVQLVGPEGGGHGSITLENMVADDDQQPEHVVHAGELRKAIGALLSSLPDHEAVVLAMRYGCKGYQESCTDEIAKALGITEAEVKKLETAAMNRIRRSHSMDDLRWFF